jgi:chemotaxis protein CheD
MLHYLLPQPGGRVAPAEPCGPMYATTGIPQLFQRLQELGCEQHRLILCAAGGAEVLGDRSARSIGLHNCTMLHQVLARIGVALAAEDTGGRSPRTLLLDLSNGEVRLRTRGVERMLWAPHLPTA